VNTPEGRSLHEGLISNASMSFLSASPACPSARAASLLSQAMPCTARRSELASFPSQGTTSPTAVKLPQQLALEWLPAVALCTTRPARCCGPALHALRLGPLLGSARLSQMHGSPDIPTASKGAISCREPGAHGGRAQELLRLLPHTCGCASCSVDTDRHRVSVAERRFNSRLGACVHLHSCAG
jgi:hypothetical protein